MAVPFSDLQAIAPSSVIELFVLELNVLQHGVADTYRFHAGSNLNANGEVVWDGNSYLRFPVEADGFEYTGNGQLPRPKIRVANILMHNHGTTAHFAKRTRRRQGDAHPHAGAIPRRGELPRQRESLRHARPYG